MPEWSKYQTAFFNEIVKGAGDIMLRATAGSGKTTTLIEGSADTGTRNQVFVAFARNNCEDFKRKIPKGQALAFTTYSVGLSALKKVVEKPDVDTDNRKYRALCHAEASLLSKRVRLEKEFAAIRRSLQELTRFCQVTLTDPGDYDQFSMMLDTYSLDLPIGVPDNPEGWAMVSEIVERVLEHGEAQAETERLISFTDMVWLPHKWGLMPDAYDVVFIDEAQDLSRAQLELVLKLRGMGGRLFFAADPRQAIFGFSGADANSYYRIIDETDAKIMPLSICYRCSKEVVKYAQGLASEIEAWEQSPEGSVQRVRESQMRLQAGDTVLCRLTAPLVSLCLRLIGQRVPARVRGKEIGKQLSEKVGMIEGSFPGASIAEFGKLVEMWTSEQVAKLRQIEGNGGKIETLYDTSLALQECWRGFQARDFEELRTQIEGLFRDDSAVIWLSTIHRFKGQESLRVFVLKPDKLPLIWKNQKPHEYAQEQNLQFVCATRAQRDLIFVDEG